MTLTGGLRKMQEYRVDAFSLADTSLAIVDEAHQVPLNSPYVVGLFEVPKLEAPSTVTINDITDGVPLTETSAAPADGEFRVDYAQLTSYVQFHSAQADHVIEVSYYGRGSPYEATSINLTQKYNSITFDNFAGDGSDGDVTVVGASSLASTNGIVKKQYTNLTIPNACTLTTDANGKVFIIGVQGTLWVQTGGWLTMIGRGAAGGAVATGGTGGYGPGNGANGAGTQAGGLGNIVSLGGSGGGGTNGAGLGGGGGGGHAAGGAGGVLGAPGLQISTAIDALLSANGHNSLYFLTSWGAGGGGGGNGGDVGGNGGGVIYIECNELRLDGDITSSGLTGTVGGGCGGGGTIVIMSNFTTGAGTIHVQGGTNVGAGNGADGFMRLINLDH